MTLHTSKTLGRRTGVTLGEFDVRETDNPSWYGVFNLQTGEWVPNGEINGTWFDMICADETEAQDYAIALFQDSRS